MADVRDEVVTEIILDGVRKYLAEWDRVNAKVDEFGNKIEKSETKSRNLSSFVTNTLSRALSQLLVQAFEEVIQAIGRAIVKFGEFTAESIGFAEDFESAIVKVHNVARDDASLEELHSLSLQLGDDVGLIGVSAIDAAEGLEVLYKGGLSTTAILGEDLTGALEGGTRELGAFKAASDLSAISTLDFDASASLAIGTLSTYGSGIGNAQAQAEFITDTFDYMVITANSSNTSVEELAQGFARAAPTLSALGYSAEETIDSLALLADAEIKGATAGTQLRRMVANLNRDTKAVTDTHNELGTSLFDTEGNLRSLEDVMASMNDALYGEGEALVYVSDLTAEQTDLLGKAEEQYDTAAEKLGEWEAGLIALSDTELDSLIEEQERALSVMDDLSEIGGEYVTVSKEMTDQDRARVIQTLAGVHGQNSLNILMGEFTDSALNATGAQAELEERMLMQGGATDTLVSAYDKLHEKQLEGKGIAEQVDALLETSAGKREVVMSMLETMQIQYGDVFIGALKETLDFIVPMMEEHLPKFSEALADGGVKLTELAEEYLPAFADYMSTDMIPNVLDFVEYLINDGIPGIMDFGTSFLQFIEDVTPFVTFVVGFIELIHRTMLIPFTEVTTALLYLADVLGITLPGSIGTGGSAMETMSSYIEIANGVLKDGLLVTMSEYTSGLIDMVFDVDSVSLAMDAQAVSSTYLADQIELNRTRWEVLKIMWVEEIMPTLELLFEVYQKNYDIYVLIWEIVGNLTTAFFEWWEETTHMKEYLDEFIDGTLTYLLEALGENEDAVDSNITVFNDLKDSIKRVIDFIKSDWQTGMDNITRGLEPVRSALENLSGYLDRLKEKLSSVASWSSNLGGGGDTASNNTSSGDTRSGGTAGTVIYNYTTNSQENTVHATTPATPSELTSVFSTMSARSM